MEKEWHLKEYSGITDEQVLALQRDMNGYFDIHLTKMLASRVGLDKESARAFLRPNLEHLHDPFLFKDMDKAVDRLCAAMDGGEKILVYGDYDVDGTTSVALVYSFLRDLIPGEMESGSDDKRRLFYYVPNRYLEGYGVSFKGVDYAVEKGCTLIIALDCGIKDNARIEYSNYKGIDFIVCDHHTPGAELPKAIAVLDAKRDDNTYPFNELSGCGVGFKFMQAYCIRKGLPLEGLLRYIDLVAVSIGSDIVPIVDENRILAYYGLKKLNGEEFTYIDKKLKLAPLVCFRAIKEEAGIADKIITIYDSVFTIGPRINAAGRMKSGLEAVHLLVSDNADDAVKFSHEISKYNQDRKDKDSEITKAALDMLEKDPDNDINTTTVVYGDNWHKGVVGIVASRLTETYYRPTIVFSKVDDKLTGSARSVSDFNLYDAIDSCRQHLTAFGGHKFAAGLNLKFENFPMFRKAFEDYVKNHIQEHQLRPKIEVEQELDFKSITLDFYNKLKQFEPFGPDNPEPVFATFDVYDYGGTKRIGKDQSHLRLEVVDKSGVPRVGIGFGFGDCCEKIKQGVPFNICYTLSLNEFNGRTSIQLMIKDIKF